jgi:electron transfer flavoprotein alpha subunit
VVESVAAAASPGRMAFRGMIRPEAGGVDITKQEILVSVGRGIESQENIELVEELAEALGATVSASRPIIDSGWMPKVRQVGKSGLTVKPKLYLAVGISGAPEHLQGMKDAELIVAINTDPNAPIFDVADYGVCADLFDVVPALTECAKASA